MRLRDVGPKSYCHVGGAEMRTLLQWRNDADGFAFDNRWILDSSERAALNGLAAPAIAGAVGSLASVIHDPLFVATLAATGQAAMTLSPSTTQGMSGGMIYSAADHWIARAPLPRGANRTLRPVRVGTIGT